MVAFIIVCVYLALGVVYGSLKTLVRFKYDVEYTMREYVEDIVLWPAPFIKLLIKKIKSIL